MNLLINYIILTLFLKQMIKSLNVSVGEYPGYMDINSLECGLRYVPSVYNISFDRNCFTKEKPNKTIIIYNNPNKQANTISLHPRIYNGQDAQYGESPWTVFLVAKKGWWIFKKKGICTGVLITFEWILTAAHCLDQWESADVVAHVGSNQLSGLETIEVNNNKMFIHPNKTSGQPMDELRYDIALVKTIKKFTRLRNNGYNYLINTVCLPNKSFVGNNWEELVTFFGFGSVGDLKLPQLLQKGSALLMTSCIVDQMLCTNQTGLPSRGCVGDSGSGLIKYNKYNKAILIGIFSPSWPKIDPRDCNKVHTLGFVAVQRISDWILDTISNN